VAVELVHAIGMFAAAVIDTTALAFKPVAEMNSFAGVPAGAKVVPEFTLPAPRVSVTFGVTVNVAVATLPKLSVTVTVCAPATPACEVAFPAGVVNMNAAVPCSVTFAGVYVAALALALLPTLTEVIVAVGPKPDTVAVTTVPTGPELGDSVRVAGESESDVVATLPQLSVRVNDELAVTAPRLTVPVYVPVAESTLLLSVVGVPVLLPEATSIGFPENVALVIEVVKAELWAVLLVGNPEPVTITEDPAAPDEGERVTVGAVIVKVPATTDVVASEIITVCAPTERF
jgi:hypothetical protein